MKNKFLFGNIVCLFVLYGIQAFGDAAIEWRVSKDLLPISEALTRYWDYLYLRSENKPSSDSGFERSQKRTGINSEGVKKGLAKLGPDLRKAGLPCLVMGGGYEVDLTLLLENCSRVDLVDLSPKPLQIADKKYQTNPHHDRLHLIVSDLSGLPVPYQKESLAHIVPNLSVEKNLNNLRRYFKDQPKVLEPLAFPSLEYGLVVSPMLVESLAYGPLIPFFENQKKNKSAGQDLEKLLGSQFYFEANVVEAFQRVFLHHSKELRRILVPGGVAVFSVWKGLEGKFIRVGNNRLPAQGWEDFFKGWDPVVNAGVFQPNGPGTQASLSQFLLKKGVKVAPY